MKGSLDIILGPPYSGKTETLIYYYYRYRNDCKILAINHIDGKRTTINQMYSKCMSMPCISLNVLSDIEKIVNLADYDRIMINNGHLFPDVYYFVNKLLDKKKYVWLACIDSKNKEPYEQIHKLIPIADYMIKKNGKCDMCKNPSVLTKITADVEITVCRECYDDA